MIERKLQNITSYNIVKTVRGDTFDKLALEMYGDESRATDIMKFNPQYIDVLVFDSNIELKVPNFDDIRLGETLPPWYQDGDENVMYEVEDDEE